MTDFEPPPKNHLGPVAFVVLIFVGTALRYWGRSLHRASREPTQQASSEVVTPQLLSAEYVDDYRVRLRFGDGFEAQVDLAGELQGEAFAALRDPDLFCRFWLDAQSNSLTWTTGASFAPEFLYDCARRRRD